MEVCDNIFGTIVGILLARLNYVAIGVDGNILVKRKYMGSRCTTNDRDLYG